MESPPVDMSLPPEPGPDATAPPGSPSPGKPSNSDSDSKPDSPRRVGGNAITRAWEADWLTSRGVPYPTSGQDAMALAAAKKRLGGDFGKLRDAWGRMLASTDALDVKNASVEWFCKRLPGFLVEARALSKAERGDLEVLEACRRLGVA